MSDFLILITFQGQRCLGNTVNDTILHMSERLGIGLNPKVQLRAETWTRGTYHTGNLSPLRKTYSMYTPTALKPFLPLFQSLVSENSIYIQMN